jgi:hypothetical protein
LSGLPVPNFAFKVCPLVAGAKPSCGGDPLKNGGCKGCQSYPAQSFCHVAYHRSLDSCFAASGDKPATTVEQLQVPQYWPPDHRVEQVKLESCMELVFDPCNPSLTAADIVASPSFQVDYAGADEAFDPADITVTAPDTVSFVVERNGAGSGRTYHVGASYTNELGVLSRFECRFAVPHDQGAHNP